MNHRIDNLKNTEQGTPTYLSALRLSIKKQYRELGYFSSQLKFFLAPTFGTRSFESALGVLSTSFSSDDDGVSEYRVAYNDFRDFEIAEKFSKRKTGGMKPFRFVVIDATEIGRNAGRDAVRAGRIEAKTNWMLGGEKENPVE